MLIKASLNEADQYMKRMDNHHLEGESLTIVEGFEGQAVTGNSIIECIYTIGPDQPSRSKADKTNQSRDCV